MYAASGIAWKVHCGLRQHSQLVVHALLKKLQTFVAANGLDAVARKYHGVAIGHIDAVAATHNGRNHHSVGILHLLKNPEKYSLSIVREGAKQFFSVQDE